MNPTTFQVHGSWLLRAALVLVATGLATAAVVWFAQRPLPWAALIPGTLPLSLYIFVAMPLLKQEKQESQLKTDH
jgi:hypothetical protein